MDAEIQKLVNETIRTMFTDDDSFPMFTDIVGLGNDTDKVDNYMGINESASSGTNMSRGNYLDMDRVTLTDEQLETLMGPIRDDMTTAIPMTAIYLVIFITGVIGNVCTCVVISRNRYMHTATNFYLFSLAISDLLLLLLGLPTEFYEIWYKYPYIFGTSFCIVRGLCAETSANASILTITAFTVERYVAICHPLQAHTISRPSRAVKFIIAIWIMATSCAIPLALQFGIEYKKTNAGLQLWQTARCTVIVYLPHAFEISTFLFFCLPAAVILILYLAIGIRLRQSSCNRSPTNAGSSQEWNGQLNNARHHGGSSRRTVIKMLGE